MNEELGNPSQSPGHVLVVDDEPFIRNAFKLYLETHGFKVSSAPGGEQAFEIFRDETRPVDLILLDLVLPGFQGLELLRQFKAERSLVEVIIATGCGSMNSAIEALRLGAFDYITKPIVDFDRDLLTVVEKALADRRHKLDQIAAVRNQVEGDSPSESGRFYSNMESLAASLSHSTSRESALAAVEGFFEEHFRATGGVVFDHSAESMSFRDGWGTFRSGVGEEVTPPDAAEVAFWRPLLRSTSKWEEISAAALLTASLGGGDEAPLEVLRIPLEPAREASGESTSLFVFREPLGDAPLPPPQTALLALVVKSALSRSMAGVPV